VLASKSSKTYVTDRLGIKFRVLFITPHIFEGGAEKAILNLVYRLNLLGCDAHIASLSADLRKIAPHLSKLDFLLPNKPFAPLVLNSLGSIVIGSVRELFCLGHLLRSYGQSFDVICVCNFPSYWASYFVNVNKPIVWFSSEVLSPVNQTKDVYDRSLAFRFSLQIAQIIDKHIVNAHVDKIVTCSVLNGRLIKTRYGRDALVFPTGVDYDFFNVPIVDAKGQIGLDEGPLLLQVGALMQRKNQIFSVRVLQKVKRRFRSAKLVLVGEGPWRTVLEREAKSLGLADDVIFLGSVSEDMLRILYHACDVNLFPVMDQTWGLVPFEALAAGKISIISSGAGAAEVIKSKSIGFVVDLSIDTFSETILTALHDHSLIDDMIKRGQNYIKQYLTWDKYALDIFKVLAKIAGQKEPDLDKMVLQSSEPQVIVPSGMPHTATHS
jgi:glycosyltransferase involved in cell wall biosynthesis